MISIKQNFYSRVNYIFVLVFIAESYFRHLPENDCL